MTDFIKETGVQKCATETYTILHSYFALHSQVEVRLTEQLVEACFNDMRMASHKHIIGRFGQLSTNLDHMPDNHRLYVDQIPENAKDWANGTGCER